MATDYKAQVLAANLKASLEKQAFACSDVLFDTNGVPYLQVGTSGIGAQGALVRLWAHAPLGTDALGLTARSFGPHAVQIVGELSVVAGVLVLNAVNSAILTLEAGKLGAKVELYARANGTAPVLADFVAANLVAAWYPSTKWNINSAS